MASPGRTGQPSPRTCRALTRRHLHLYLKTHNFPGTLQGRCSTRCTPCSKPSTELAIAVDDIAERIRMGFPAPGTYAAYARHRLTRKGRRPLRRRDDQAVGRRPEAVVRTARGIFPLLDKVNAQADRDLLTQRMQSREKTAWLLRSLLGLSFATGRGAICALPRSQRICRETARLRALSHSSHDGEHAHLSPSSFPVKYTCAAARTRAVSRTVFSPDRRTFHELQPAASSCYQP